MSEKVTIVLEAIDNASRVLTATGGKLQSLGGNVSGAGKELKPLTIGIGAAAAGLGVLANQASTLSGVRNAFYGIAEDGDAMLASLEASSAGIITQRDLMTSYNKAAQLVSPTFAETLPDAMGYLSKVSLATGEDMGFMLNSLVTGVGRLSPMILDNLGIQVDLTKASKDYAAQIGKEVKQLTKQEQQTALTNQVLELLAKNTASMPSASNPLAETTTGLINMKDEIATELMPAMVPMLASFTTLITTIAPPMIALLGSAADKFAGLSPGTQTVILGLIGVAAAAGPVLLFVGMIISSLGTLMTAAGAVGAFISGPGLVGALASVSAILTGPVLLGIGAVVGAVVLMRRAWTNNFGGIQEITAAVWESVLKWFDLFKGLFSGDVSWGEIGYAAGTALINGLIDLNEWGFRLRSFLVGLPGRMVTFVREIDWSGIGQAIIEMIKSALDFDAMIREQIGKIGGFGTSVLEGAANFGAGLAGGARDAITNNNGATVNVNYNDYSGGGANNAALVTQSYEAAYAPAP